MCKIGLKHIFRSLAVALTLLAVSAEASAQYYTAGSDPAGISWRKIDFTNYSVIFPEGMDSLAKRYLYLLEKSRDHAQEGMRITVPKVPVVLHPYAIGGNSTAAWGPKRLEICTTPKPYGNLPQNYEELTALRTNRLLGYMSQYDTYTFNFFQHVLFGQQAVAFGVGFYPSVWQATGDANLFVGDETCGGFGRSGESLMYYRAAFVDGDMRAYDRWRYGSYRDYTPGSETFGYMLNSNFRFYSGNYYAMGDALHLQMRDWWDFFGVWNKSFLTATGKTVRKHWRFISAYYPTVWSDDYMKRGTHTTGKMLEGTQEKLYTEYRDPVRIGNVFYASKWGMLYPKRLVSIDSTGRQRRLMAFSENTSRIVASPDGSLYWSEVVRDPRWELKSTSIIRCYDPKTGRTKDITHDTRYFNPTFSSSGDTMFVAQYSPSGSTECVLLNTNTGSVICNLGAPRKGQITEMIMNGDLLYALSITGNGLGLYSASPMQDAGWDCEIPPQPANMEHLSVHDGKIQFVCDRDGVCSIYEFDPFDKTITKLTNARFGNFYPTFDEDGNLWCADYDRMGHHIVKIPADSLISVEVPMKYDRKDAYPMAERLSGIARRTLNSKEEDGCIDLQDRIDTLRSEPYRKGGKGLFNFHSWAPFYANINRISAMSYDEFYQLAGLGATVISQNTLGTAVTQIGYEAHRDPDLLDRIINGEKVSGRNKWYHSGHVNFNYTGWYPAVELTADINDHALVYKGIGKPFSLDASAKVYVPWDFSKGGWNRGLMPYLQGGWSNDGIYDYSWGARYWSMLAKSKRQLSPRLGFGIEADGRRAISDMGTRDLAYIYLYGYLPGITKDQSIKLTVSHQRQWNDSSTPVDMLSNLASMPRGYSKAGLSDYTKFTFDYGIFVYLGDVTWPWLYYLHRLQVIPFADFAINRAPQMKVPDYLYSYGADVLLCGHYFRIGSEINLGFRYARTADGKNTWSVIFNNSLK